MMNKIVKISFLVIFNIAIIGSVNKAEAFPLPTLDITRIKTGIQNTMHAIEEIKQEIQSNIQIIKEIQNGGFLAAAGDLFGKIQNGDYDRFGQNLKMVKYSMQDVSSTYASAKVQNQRMKELQEQGLTRAQAKAVAAQEAAVAREKAIHEAEQKAYEKAKEKAINHRIKELQKEGLSESEARAKAEGEYANKSAQQIALENAYNSKFNNVYNWLRNSRGVTSNGFDAIRAGMEGDWSQAIASAGASAGSGFAISGDENFGTFIGAGAGVVGGIMDATQAGDINEAYRDLKYNFGGVLNNAGDMGIAYQNYDDEQAAIKDAENIMNKSLGNNK